jgi:tetratricopeptide (TPR) repeat protein
MAETTGGKERRGKTAGRPARPPPGKSKQKSAAPPRSAAKKTLGRRKPSAKSVRPEAPREPKNGGPQRAPQGTDWDAMAEKASAKIEQTAERAGDAARRAGVEAKRIALDLSDGLDDAFGKLRTEAEHMVKRGQHTRVRINFRGKKMAELPVAVVAAAEVASLWWAGPLRLILAHVVGKTVLDVEFVNDAAAHVTAGRNFLASGDLDDALKEFDRAIAMDRRNPGAHLGKGIAYKLRGDKEAARRELAMAEEYDPRGESGREARRHLDNLT